MLNKKIIKNHEAIMNNYSEVCITYDYSLIHKHKCTILLLIEQREHCVNDLRKWT